MALVHLAWQFCPEGYRLEEKPAGSGKTIIEDYPAYEVIVPKSRRLIDNTPLKVDGVYLQLADVKSKEDALGFVSLFGFLRREKARSEPVDEVLEAAEDMRRIIDAGEKGDWEFLRGWLEVAGGVGRLGVHLVPKTGQLPDLQFRPQTLLDAVRVQALQDLTGATKIRKCANPACPAWFKYGPGTNPPRRKTALYCKTACEKAYAYQKKKESEK